MARYTMAAMNPLTMHSYTLLFQHVKGTITWINCRIVLTHETQFFVKVSVSHCSMVVPRRHTPIQLKQNMTLVADNDNIFQN